MILITLEKWQDIAKLCRKYEANALDSVKGSQKKLSQEYYKGAAESYRFLAELIEKGELVVDPSVFNDNDYLEEWKKAIASRV